MDCKIVGFAIVILICWVGYYPLACEGTEVWPDDFNDGDYDGWTVCNNTALWAEYEHPTKFGFSGSNWSAANNYLQLDHEELGLITHPSEVVYGTWSFDFNANESNIGSTADIAIISTDHYHTALTEDDWSSPERTVIWIRFEVYPDEDLWTLNSRNNGERTTIDYKALEHIEGWHHIVVTRNTTGWFEVFHNDVQIMDGQDNNITSSQLFSLWFEDRQMIDNIVVDNEIRTTTTGTTDGGFDPMLLVALGGVGAVVIIAVLVIILRRR